MITTLDQMFQMMSAMAQLKTNLESLPKAQTKSSITPVAKRAKMLAAAIIELPEAFPAK